MTDKTNKERQQKYRDKRKEQKAILKKVMELLDKYRKLDKRGDKS